jgi:inorganic pyrophosphatase
VGEKKNQHRRDRVCPVGSNKVVNIVIETPMGSRNKFKYDPELGQFALSGVLPQGMMFPYAFGFVPRTKSSDGDPTDVLLIMDEQTFTGCVVPSRLLGIIEAEQTEDGKTERNDRLLAVAAHTRDHSHLQTLNDINPDTLAEIEQFFVNYNRVHGKEFKVLGRKGPREAWEHLRQALE